MRKRWLAIVLGALLLLLFLGPAIAAVQPGFYERYRLMREPIENWRSSTHAQMGCVSCHLDPGVVNLFLFAARSVPAFYVQLVGRAATTRLLTTPSRFACRKCHTTYRTVSAGGDLLIPHQAHVELLRLDCTNCHRKLVHWPNPMGFNRPKMANCLSQCHDGRKAKDRCTDCHTEKAMPANHRGGDWFEVHGLRTEEINCGACHGWAPKLCERCHTDRPRTHVGNWKKLHVQRAGQRGKGCLVCHGGSRFCLRCHDMGLFEKPLFKGLAGDGKRSVETNP